MREPAPTVILLWGTRKESTGIRRTPKHRVPYQAAAENGRSPDEPKDEKAKANESFHQRARESHAEARKLLTAMAVGGLGVLYATLIGKDAPKFDDAYSKHLAIGIAVSIASAAVLR